jgi:hypothetical protein
MQMNAATPMLEKYLRTLFRPDCDYVDGAIVDRNVGEFEHSFTMVLLLQALTQWEANIGIEPLPSVRVKVSASRYGVPDICVVRLEDPFESLPSESRNSS